MGHAVRLTAQLFLRFEHPVHPSALQNAVAWVMSLEEELYPCKKFLRLAHPPTSWRIILNATAAAYASAPSMASLKHCM